MQHILLKNQDFNNQKIQLFIIFVNSFSIQGAAFSPGQTVSPGLTILWVRIGEIPVDLLIDKL